MDAGALLPLAARTAVDAGRAILEVYRSAFDVHHKADRSPLTQADLQAHRIIAAALAPAGLPLLSEEGRDIPYAERRAWERFWLVDPLDGTREFVSRNGEFTVNIALVDRGRPILGVVYVPVPDRMYAGQAGTGAWVLEEAGRHHFTGASLPTPPAGALPLPRAAAGQRPFTVVGSRSHATAELEAYVAALRRTHGAIDYISAGSSLKLCLVAEGRADLYPRLGPTMEWDTAAGQAVAEAAGAVVRRHDTDQPLSYNKPDLLNPWFVVEGKHRTLPIDLRSGPNTAG